MAMMARIRWTGQEKEKGETRNVFFFCEKSHLLREADGEKLVSGVRIKAYSSFRS